MEDGSFYDKYGYYFDAEGYDQYGGYYEDGEYKPGEPYKESYYQFYTVHEDDDDYDINNDEYEQAIMKEHVLPAIKFLKEQHAKAPTTLFTIKIRNLNNYIKQDKIEGKLKSILPNKEDFKIVLQLDSFYKKPGFGFFISSNLENLLFILNMHHQVILSE